MNTPDLEVLKADVETLCSLAHDAARKLEGYQDTSDLADNIYEVTSRIRRIIADPVDNTSLHATREMNRNPNGGSE